MLLLTVLGVYGIKFTALQILLFYIVVILIAGFIGMFLAKIGVVKYNQRLSNAHNPELTEILERIKKMGENDDKEKI